MRQGMQIPNAIKDAPTLHLGLELYMSAWLDLNTCRSVGMGEGPIPWLAVHEWANQHELDDDQREALHVFIVALDAAYFEHRERKRERDRES